MLKGDISYINTPSHEGRSGRKVRIQQHVACAGVGGVVIYRDRIWR